MNTQIENAGQNNESLEKDKGSFDYTYVNAVARIALYDDLLSAPRVTVIKPAPTDSFIENLASTIHEQAKSYGGTIPYTVIREVSENFIHAQFSEITVSILDQGTTIKFADQGPGIPQKEKAQLPGFSSAIEPMKHYIRGVGSGLPIVKEYLDFSQGTITIEDNLITGSVVTISLNKASKKSNDFKQENKSTFTTLIPPLSSREKDFLLVFLSEGALGVTDISNLTEVPMSSTHSVLKKLEQSGLIEKTAGQKRILTELGFQVSSSL